MRAAASHQFATVSSRRRRIDPLNRFESAGFPTKPILLSLGEESLPTSDTLDLARHTSCPLCFANQVDPAVGDPREGRVRFPRQAMLITSRISSDADDHFGEACSLYCAFKSHAQFREREPHREPHGAVSRFEHPHCYPRDWETAIKSSATLPGLKNTMGQHCTGLWVFDIDDLTE